LALRTQSWLWAAGGLLGFALRRPGAIAGLYEKGFVEISGVTPQAIEAATSMPVMHPESD